MWSRANWYVSANRDWFQTTLFSVAHGLFSQIRTLTGHAGWITACLWTPPKWGKYFVSCSRDATIRLWSPDSSWAVHKVFPFVQPLHKPSHVSWIPLHIDQLEGTHTGSIVSVDMSSNGSRFVSGSFDGNVKTFSVKPKRRWSLERDDLSGLVGGSPSELVEEEAKEPSFVGSGEVGSIGSS